MNLETITPLVLTYNEEPNLERTLKRLSWAREVVVLDSGSSDATAEIAQRFDFVRWETRRFDDHTQQWNHGVDLISMEWVLALDADYVLGAGFEDELTRLTGEFDAYQAGFRYLILGQPLRGSLYPPRAVLFRKSRCRYVQDGHTQLLQVPGAIGPMQTKIDHDDRKPLSRWLVSQDKYAVLEAEKLMAVDSSQLRPQDRLRRTMWAAVPISLIYTLFVRGVIWDGWHGWYYALQRVLAEMLLALRLIERRLR